jgi:hypothetical protein
LSTRSTVSAAKSHSRATQSPGEPEFEWAVILIHSSKENPGSRGKKERK